MAWRKWLIRSLVFSALGLAALMAVVYQAWTNPAAVRAMVLKHIHRSCVADAVSVSLESAQLRLLGGIAVSELRIARSDGLDRKDFLYVPSAVVYHDKERLAQGAFAVRKVELHRPQLRLVREHDGRCNLTGLFAPADPSESLPTVVVQQGTVLLEDRAAVPGTPVLEIKDVALTAVEDPPGVVTVAGTGRTDVAGPVHFGAVVQRAGGDLTATLDLTEVRVQPELVQRLSFFCPNTAAQVRQLRGDGKVQASFTYRPASSQPFAYDVTCSLVNGALSHALLPLPLENLGATVHCVNGRIPLAHFTAQSGDARMEMTLRDVVPAASTPESVYDPVGELDLRVDHLALTNDLLQQLPEGLRDLRDAYKPAGVLNLTHTFRRDGPGKWRKRWVLRPDGMEANYSGFPYRVGRVTGSIDYEYTSDDATCTDVDLTGYSGDRPVTLKGKVCGPAAGPAVDLEIATDDLPLDDHIFQALPEAGQKIVRQFLPDRSRVRGLEAEPIGRADVKATIHRPQGKDFANRYLIHFHDASVKYDVFPIPLEKVTGDLELRTPGGWQCRGFRAVHDGGALRVDGRSYASPAAAGVQDRIYVVIQGDEIPVDTETFKNALSPSESSARATLRRTWETMGVSGRMGFRAVVDASLDQPNDIDVSVSVDGCSLKPRYFPFALNQLTGAVRYTHDQVFLTNMQARHGASVLSLKQGQVTLKPGGGFQARLGSIRGAPLAPDADFLEALPDGLRNGLKKLNLHGPVTATTDMVVDAPSEPGGAVVMWWDGSMDLHDAALRLGVDLTGVEGQAACCGLYNGRRLESLVGNVLLEKAELFGQPLQHVHTRVEVEPGSPETMRFRDLKADLYGGTVGGEGRLEFGAGPRFDLTLKALQIDLGEFARHNSFGGDAQIKGLASAAVHLSGDGADVSGLKGNGRIDVPEGKLYRLPMQLGLLKAFGLRLPDRTAFEQAHAVFAIDGPELQVQRLDLYGNAVSLRGMGTAGLDGGNLNLDFSADWGRVAQMLPPGVSDIPRTVSDQILKIKMRGRIGDTHFEKELAPGVVDWVERAISP